LNRVQTGGTGSPLEPEPGVKSGADRRDNCHEIDNTVFSTPGGHAADGAMAVTCCAPGSMERQPFVCVRDGIATAFYIGIIDFLQVGRLAGGEFRRLACWHRRFLWAQPSAPSPAAVR
jgi:hypothetical protein